MNALQVAERSAAYALQSAAPSISGEAFDLMVTAPQGVVTLRELILSLAVQGKLVAQSRRDEPASTLTARLDQIRRKMVAAGAIRDVKNEAAPEGYRETDRLPDGWIVAPLSNLAWPQAGFAFKSSNFNDTGNGLPLIRIRDVGANAPRTFFSGEYRDEFLVQSGDWLIGMDGDFRVERWTGPKALLNQRVTRLIFFGEVIQPLYVCIALQQALRRLQGTKAYTTVDHLSGKQIASRPIPLPPLAEQRRIVARVEELMDLCDDLEAHGRLQDEQHVRLVSTVFDALVASASPEELTANWQRVASYFDLLLDRPEAVDALEQTILQLAVRGLLVPQDPTNEPASHLLARISQEKEQSTRGTRKRRRAYKPSLQENGPFVLPAGWVWAHFTDLGEFGRGKSKHRPRNDPRLFDPGIYPLIQTGEVSRADGFIEEIHSYYSEEGLAQSKLWPKGTLCITIAANIADSAMLRCEACFPDSIVGFIPSPLICDTRYFHTFMRTARQRLIDFAPATAQKNINLEVLGNLLIPLPPVAEMHRIVARIEELRGLCADLRKSLQQARTTQSNVANALAAQAIA